jgi:hypothetical protein
MMEAFKPVAPQQAPTTAPSYTSKQPLFSVIEEKLDRILAYQKKTAQMESFRAIMSFIFFLVFVVLPIIGCFYLYDYMQASGISLQSVVEQYKGALDTVGKLKETTDQIGNIKDSIQTPINIGDVQKALDAAQSKSKPKPAK